MSTDWKAIFASLQVRKIHPHVKKMELADQYSVLALYVHEHSECDAEGWFQPSMRQLVVELFGYERRKLKDFMSGLVPSGLFLSNELNGLARCYRVQTNDEFNTLVEQYRAFVAETPTPRLPASTPEGSSLGAPVKDGQQHIVDALKKAENDELGADPDEPTNGMSDAVKSNRLADYIAREIEDDLQHDPDMMQLVGERLIANAHRMKNQ